MSDNEKNKGSMRKGLLLASIAYGAFTAISVIAPIILDKLSKRRQNP
ncbi:MAG TPA: hypothetical protein VKV40_18360 [Ktedonobacteraceae bacterium]|nr:hypothetical protein [Ktedonobacteraceae bacterium]